MPDQEGTNLSPTVIDPYVEAVKAKYDERSRIGQQKYGTDLTREDFSYDQWLTHAQEEAMDFTLYVEKLKSFRREIKEEKKGQDFRELQAEIYKNAVEKGFWNPTKSVVENIALIHSELSEALEEYRENKPLLYYNDSLDGVVPFDSHGTRINPKLKPEGIAAEMADVVIRIMDWAESENIDLWNVIVIKHLHNKTREYRHGGKKL